MTKTHPEGETAEEALARVAPEPLFYKVELSGSADDVDVADVEKAYRAFVKALRKAGVTVNGALTGNVPAAATVDGPRREQRILHELAGDVDD